MKQEDTSRVHVKFSSKWNQTCVQVGSESIVVCEGTIVRQSQHSILCSSTTPITQIYVRGQSGYQYFDYERVVIPRMLSFTKGDRQMHVSDLHNRHQITTECIEKNPSKMYRIPFEMFSIDMPLDDRDMYGYVYV
jgi:hypothetical protein